MENIKTKGGADLSLSPADFKDAIALKNSLLKSLKGDGVKALSNLDLQDLKNKNATKLMSDIMGAVVEVDSSEEVYRNIFNCLKRSTYNGERITESTFNNVEAREDYYEVIMECVKVNMMPFFKNLFSQLESLASLKVVADQKQK